jgi:serine/threonine-protein kinase
LVWVDHDGRTTPLGIEAGGYEWPRLSPDGKRVAVTDRTAEGKIDIWILDIERRARNRLMSEGSNILPTWTTDGREIAFGSSKINNNVVGVYRKPADGSGETQRILDAANPRFPASWSPAGHHLAFVEWHPETMRDIWIYSELGQPESEAILATPFDEYDPQFSPDGRWLVYVSDESGRYEIYVRSYAEDRGRWLVSARGGIEPHWSPSGQEIYYRLEDKMMVVPIRTEPTFSVGAPSVVFEKAFKSGIYGTLSYDVSPDGQRFLMIERNTEITPNQLNVVLHWSGELQRKVPVMQE